jgi:hypothetical protein
MKYEIDIPVCLPDNYPATVQIGEYLYHLGLKSVPAPSPIRGKSATIMVMDDAPVKWEDRVYAVNHHQLLHTAPEFDNLDREAKRAAFPRMVVPLETRIGSEWTTLDGWRVKVIARHTDGDCEVTVLAAGGGTHAGVSAQDERRGIRVGSSYIVDKWGKVKPGHLAPPAGMNLKFPAEPANPKPLDLPLSAACAAAVREVVKMEIKRALEPAPKAEPMVHYQGTPVFTLAQHNALMHWFKMAGGR